MGQNDIQRAGLNDILRRSLTIKGDQPPSQVVGAEIVPVLVLENDRPEYLYLADERRVQVDDSQAGVAGQFCKSVLWNPRGSGVIAVLEHLTFYTGDVGPAFISVLVFIAGPFENPQSVIGGGAVQIGTVCTDFRFHNQSVAIGTIVQQGALQCWHLTSAGDILAGIFFLDICEVKNRMIDVVTTRCGELVIPPGWLVACRAQIATAMCAGYQWRERAIEPNERAPGGPPA